jgi:hypothetical protein
MPSSIYNPNIRKPFVVHPLKGNIFVNFGVVVRALSSPSVVISSGSLDIAASIDCLLYTRPMLHAWHALVHLLLTTFRDENCHHTHGYQVSKVGMIPGWLTVSSAEL